jgi:hypothetical protein
VRLMEGKQCMKISDSIPARKQPIAIPGQRLEDNTVTWRLNAGIV